MSFGETPSVGRAFLNVVYWEMMAKQQSASVPAVDPNALPFTASYPPSAPVPMDLDSGTASATAAASAFAPMASLPQQPFAQPLAFSAVPIVVSSQPIQLINCDMGLLGVPVAPVLQLALVAQPSAAAMPQQSMAMVAPIAPVPSGSDGGSGSVNYDLTLHNEFFRLRDEIFHLLRTESYLIIMDGEIIGTVLTKFEDLINNYEDFQLAQQQFGGSNNPEYQLAMKEMDADILFFKNTFVRVGLWNAAQENLEADLKEWDAVRNNNLALNLDASETLFAKASNTYITADKNGSETVNNALDLVNQAIAKKFDIKFFSLRARIYHRLIKFSKDASENQKFIDLSLADFEKIENHLTQSDRYTYIWTIIFKFERNLVLESQKYQLLEKMENLLIRFKYEHCALIGRNQLKYAIKVSVDIQVFLRKFLDFKYDYKGNLSSQNVAAANPQQMFGMGFGQNSAMAAPMPVPFGGGGGGGGGWNPAYNPSANAADEMERKQAMSTNETKIEDKEKLFSSAESNFRRANHNSKHPSAIPRLRQAFEEISRAIELGGCDVAFFRLRTAICSRLNGCERLDTSTSDNRLERCRIALEDFKKIPDRDMSDEGAWTWIHVSKYHLTSSSQIEQKTLLLSIITTGFESYKSKFNASNEDISGKELKRVEERLRSLRMLIDDLKKTLDADKAALGNLPPANAANNAIAAAAAAAAPNRSAASESVQPNLGTAATASTAAALPNPVSMSYMSSGQNITMGVSRASAPYGGGGGGNSEQESSPSQLYGTYRTLSKEVHRLISEGKDLDRAFREYDKMVIVFQKVQLAKERLKNSNTSTDADKKNLAYITAIMKEMEAVIKNFEVKLEALKHLSPPKTVNDLGIASAPAAAAAAAPIRPATSASALPNQWAASAPAAAVAPMELL